MAKVNEIYNKTNSYLKRNGLEKTAFAVADSLVTKTPKSFKYQLSTNDEIKAQKAWSKRFAKDLKFSLIVPAYKTNEVYFREMVASVLAQTYENWELIIVDGTPGFKLKDELEIILGVLDSKIEAGVAYKPDELNETFAGYADMYIQYKYFEGNVKYLHILNNGGISANSNYALSLATGDYVGMIDHDDLLTPDALYAFSKALISNEYKAKLIYSDEDKTDAKGRSYYDPNRKTDFNLDLFLSNNYICHLTFLERELIQALKFRSEYDGAQDFDLFLRAVRTMEDPGVGVLHIPKILYHWRSHEGSTAGNADAKQYAYEAGRRAVDDYCKSVGWAVNVCHTAHLGFYSIEYKNTFFSTRPNVGVICGPIYKFGKISGGAMKEDGTVIYRGLAKGLGGYLHRGSLVQDVGAGDVRNMRINPVLENLYDEMVEAKLAKNVPDYVEISLEFCKKVRELGYLIVYNPENKPE